MTPEEHQLKEKVWEEIVDKKRDKATELLAQYILNHEHIYTTRVDDNAEFWIYNKGIYIPQGKTYIKEFCRKILTTAYSTQLVNAVIAKIEAETYIDHNEFFSNNIKDKIITLNGILDLKTRELEDFDPEQIFFTKIPVEYNPELTCPNIEKHFKAVLENEEDAEVMFELFGYLLYKEYKIEKAIMFIGDGRNGKGKTLDLMKRFIGIDNCSSVPLQQLETDIYSSSELFNILANLSGDLDSKALRNTGTLKNLTGRDLIAAPRKFLNRINFVNFAKMIFACNKLPKTYDISTAFFNRWVLFEFPYTFLSQEEIDIIPENERKNIKLRDTEIIEKISSTGELSGLLNKALDGLDKVMEQMDFSHSKGVKSIMDTWIRKSDSFLAFALDNLIEEDDIRILKLELRKAYNKYCKLHKVKPVSDKALRETLFEAFAVSEERDADGQYWRGISFREGKVIEDLKGVKSVM